MSLLKTEDGEILDCTSSSCELRYFNEIMIFLRLAARVHFTRFKIVTGVRQSNDELFVYLKKNKVDGITEKCMKEQFEAGITLL